MLLWLVTTNNHWCAHVRSPTRPHHLTSDGLKPSEIKLHVEDVKGKNSREVSLAPLRGKWKEWSIFMLVIESESMCLLPCVYEFSPIAMKINRHYSVKKIEHNDPIYLPNIFIFLWCCGVKGHCTEPLIDEQNSHSPPIFLLLFRNWYFQDGKMQLYFAM